MRSFMAQPVKDLACHCSRAAVGMGLIPHPCKKKRALSMRIWGFLASPVACRSSQAMDGAGATAVTTPGP